MNASIDIPGYKLLSIIGEGGTATVWRARQISLDREVAIKILRQQFAADAVEVQAFLREAHAVAKLNSRHIIHIIDAGQHADTIYLVMEYVDGYPVQRLLDDGKPIAQTQALNIALSVADALCEAWESEKIIHRDIKPANIMLNQRGEVKVADLGLAGMVDPKGKLIGEDDGVIAGTPNYMSPEQAAGSSAMNFAADMYSLGAVLYHLLTGCMPFDGRDAGAVLSAQISEQIPHPCELNPKISSSCAQLIARLMMKDPAQRYPEWQAVIDDMIRILDGKMVIIKHAAEGASTIAARRENVPGKKEIRRGPVSAAVPGVKPPDAGVKPPDRGPQAPAWLRWSLQAAVAVFFAWLLHALLWVPYRDTVVSAGACAPEVMPPAPVMPPASVPAVMPPAPAPVVMPPAPAPVNRGRQPVRPSSAPVQSEDPLDRIPDPVPAEREQTPEVVPDNPPEPAKQPVLDILKNSIVHVAVSGGINAALTLLEQQRNEPALADARARLDEMERVLRGAARPHALIAEQFRQLVGKDTFINAGARRVDFRVEAVNGETVTTIIRVPPNSGATDYMAELKIEVLEPAEKRRWLGMGGTQEAAFCMAILDLTSGNADGALANADACGPFADAIRQFSGKQNANRVGE